jgi:inorganic triphosphatase YgiF
VSTTTSARLTDDQQAEFLELAKEADSVELKLTVPELDHASTVAGLGMDPLQAQIRQVFFFDTPELALDEAGVVVRARRRAS